MRLRRPLTSAAVALGIVLAIPGVASAHSGFTSGVPEPGSELGTTPGVVVLRFSEPLNVTLSRASVQTPDGNSIAGMVVGPQEITIDVPTNAQGVYSVSWTSVSLVDGHTLTGGFRFGVGVPPGAGSEGPTSSSPRVTDLFIAAGRLLEDVALLTAIGLLLLGALARKSPALLWFRSPLRMALSLALAGGIAVVCGEAFAAAGKASLGPVFSYLTTGVPGVARLIRPVLELLALAVATRNSCLVAVPVAATVIALASSGHAAAVSPHLWGIAVESVHVGTAGLWAGGIMALALQRPPEGWRGSEGSTLLTRFTPAALLAFTGTAATGLLRGFQEVGNVTALLSSSYGLVLLAKIALVVVLVQLSVLAWRRIILRPRIEAAVAVGVIGLAALLAAFPLPPVSLERAIGSETSPGGTSGLPVAGDLTMGGDAGQFLVGLTVRNTTHELAVYLHGLGSDADAAARVVSVSIDGHSAPVTRCGPTCRSVSTAVRTGDRVDVTVEGTGGGTAQFMLPNLLAPSAEQILAHMRSVTALLSSYRQDEVLRSGLATVRASYAFKAPDAFRTRVLGSAGASRTVWIGDTRYLQQQPGARWQIETGGGSPTVPSFIWDSFRPFTDARVIGRQTLGGVKTDVVVFFSDGSGFPIWFRLWIDKSGLVHRAEMRALGHFMDQTYFAFDKPISIVSPARTNGVANG